MKFVFHEPEDYVFKDINGHSGKVFATKSAKTEHLIIECDDRMAVSLRQKRQSITIMLSRAMDIL